jgi:hypothetical protein
VTDKLRVLTEDPQLRALMKRYFAAPTEREAVLEAFAEKADALHPDWQEIIERSRREGGYLRAMFIHTLKETLARPSLTAFEHFKIKDRCSEFIALFDEASPAAIRLAVAVQDMALDAGLGPDEVERIRSETRKQHGEPGAKARSKTRREKADTWKKWVTENAPKTRADYPTFNQADLADELIDLAKKQKIGLPGQGSVIGRISFLERAGLLSERERPLSKRARPRR